MNTTNEKSQDSAPRENLADDSVTKDKTPSAAKVDPVQWKKLQKKLWHSLRSQSGGADHKRDGRDLQDSSAEIWHRFHEVRSTCSSNRLACIILKNEGLGSLRKIKYIIAEGRQKSLAPDQDTRGFWGKDLSESGWVQDPKSWHIGDEETGITQGGAKG